MLRHVAIAPFPYFSARQKESIIDSNGIEVIPCIGFIFEEVPGDMDVIEYSIQVRMRLFPVDIKKVFIYQTGEIQLTSALGYDSLRECYKLVSSKHMYTVNHQIITDFEKSPD